MSPRSQASQWFFAGFLLLGVVISAAVVLGFDQRVAVSGTHRSAWMSFGVSMQVAFAGALVSAAGYFVGLWLFRATFSSMHAAITGVLCCAVLFGAWTAAWMLGFRAPKGDVYEYVLAVATFITGFGLVPLSKKALSKSASDVTG